MEDMIADEDVVVTISNKGFIKRMPVSGYRRQKRGGKGMKGTSTRDDEYVEHLQSEQAWMLSHFVCPVSRFGDFKKALAGGPKVTVSALGSGGSDPESWNEQTARDLNACARMEAETRGAIRVEAFEAPLPQSIRMAPDDSPVPNGASNC